MGKFLEMKRDMFCSGTYEKRATLLCTSFYKRKYDRGSKEMSGGSKKAWY
jgi:hypothetical protein